MTVNLDTVFLAQLVVFVLIGLPVFAIPWLLIVWLVRKLFGKKDEVNNG